jgi:hypothetical protein
MFFNLGIVANYVLILSKTSILCQCPCLNLGIVNSEDDIVNSEDDIVNSEDDIVNSEDDIVSAVNI